MKKDFNLKIALNLKKDRLEDVSCLLEKLFGSEELHTDSGLRAFKLPNNDLLEVHGPGSAYADFLFQGNNQLICIPVHDISGALEHVKEAGFKPLTEVIQVKDGFSFCYIELEQGLIINIYQNQLS